MYTLLQGTQSLFGSAPPSLFNYFNKRKNRFTTKSNMLQPCLNIKTHCAYPGEIKRGNLLSCQSLWTVAHLLTIFVFQVLEWSQICTSALKILFKTCWISLCAKTWKPKIYLRMITDANTCCWGPVLHSPHLCFLHRSTCDERPQTTQTVHLVNDTQCGKLTVLRTLHQKIFNLGAGLIITPLQD